MVSADPGINQLPGGMLYRYCLRLRQPPDTCQNFQGKSFENLANVRSTPRPWVHQWALQALSPTLLPEWKSCEKKLQGTSCWASTNIPFVIAFILASITRPVCSYC